MNGWMDGQVKKAIQGGTEQLLPEQAQEGKVGIGEWEKGVCEQIEPPFITFL